MARTKQEDRSLEHEKKEAQARAEEAGAEREDGLPDGGWGWMVVFASLVCNIVVDGVCYSFGVLQEKYVEEFNATNEQVGWVGSLLAGCYLTVGPVVSVLAERFGSRKVTIAGSVIACTGFLLSTQASSIGLLIVTWGVIGGVGFGMIYLPAIVTVGHWFDKKRAFATGLAVCGTGIGTFIFAPLSQRLVQEYEWHGAHLIIAGIVLNCVVCGACFRPLKKVKKIPRKECYQSQVEIQRGAIMKALIEEKKRQRTISNGSLDNCIITKDNRLIKIDPALLECKRNNSFIARFKRSLGFSSQSLYKSKSSLSGIPSIVIDAVNEAQRESNSARLSPVYRPNSEQSTTSPSNTMKSESPRGDDSEDSGVCADGQKAPSEAMSLNDLLKKLMQEEQSSQFGSSGSCNSVNNPVILAGNAPPPGLGASIISVQVLPNFNSTDATNYLAGVSRRNSRSENGSYINPAISGSSASFVSRSLLSIPQQMSHCSIATIAAAEQEEKKGTVMLVARVLRDMIDINLLKSPMFSLLVVASIMTLLAFFIPFFYITIKAEKIGMQKDEAVFLLSIIGITNTIGRVISGWIADRPWTNVLHLNNGALVIAGIGTILVAFCSTFSLLCVYAAVFGFCVAVFVSLRSILLVELLGIEMLTKSFGILILFQGIATMLGTPLAGRLQDTTGTVDNCFIMAGVLLLVSGLLGLPLWYLKYRRTRRDTMPPTLPEEVPINNTFQAEDAESAVEQES